MSNKKGADQKYKNIKSNKKGKKRNTYVPAVERNEVNGEHAHADHPSIVE